MRTPKSSSSISARPEAERGFAAAIFDLDGVVTRTARLHAAAWKATFDAYLRRRGEARFEPFDERADYLAYVDGKPRMEGIRCFLKARRLAASPEEEESIAQRKDALFESLLHSEGVELFPSTVRLIEALRSEGVRIGVVTSSRHGRAILAAAGIERAFDVRLDGIDLARLGLKGKPDPDMFLRCAKALGAPPERTLVFEDALSGVEAGRRGGFGLVVGVDRGGNAAALERSGADLVVRDLARLDLPRLESAFRARAEARAWQVAAEGFDAAREHSIESLFTVGNGYLGLRGALDVPLPGSQSDLFIAGLYGRKRPDLPYAEVEFMPSGRDDPYEQIVPIPSPLVLRVAGTGFRPLRRRLDMRRGLLHTDILFESATGLRTMLRTMRCASLDDPHLLLQEAALERHEHEAELELVPVLPHADPEAYPHLDEIERSVEGEVALVRYATRASGFEICIASRSLIGACRLRRLVAIFTSRDGAAPRAAALERLSAFDSHRFDALLERHAKRWSEFWRAAEVHGAAPWVEQKLRFAAYHLRIAADEDPRVSVPARALTGRAYEGHVFWDTEIFMLPFYLHAAPAIARNLLLYRRHTLEGARRRARELGYRGACMAWESTVTGDDVTPNAIVVRSTGKAVPVFTGTRQVHVSADVAYAVWRYWQASGDEAFLAGPGAELLFDTARFWASRVVRGERDFHIRGVIGPDEYHLDVADNAYTNWMARFNLERAAWAAARLDLNRAEADEWTGIARGLHCPQPDAHGVIEQFEGFFELEDYPLAEEGRMKAPVNRLFDWERINRLKLIKQADVLMLPFLFPEAFDDSVLAANYRYYEPMTDHASSLSPAVHAALAARLGLREDAERYWRRALSVDLSEEMDNSALGIHAAAMGGAWQAWAAK